MAISKGLLSAAAHENHRSVLESCNVIISDLLVRFMHILVNTVDPSKIGFYASNIRVAL